jgi:PAB-dependent poly(A)-specific ribonuclease subunit 2
MYEFYFERYARDPRRRMSGANVQSGCGKGLDYTYGMLCPLEKLTFADQWKLPAEAQYTIMKRAGQYLCAATKNGGIHILDSNSLSVIKVFEGHTGSISDMDAKGDFLATCGWSPRQQYAYMLDPFTNVFSLKTLKQLPPIPFHTGAAFVRMHPRMSTTAFIASQNGQLNFYESYLTGFEMAPSGEAIALADSNSQIHLWGSPTKVHFPEYSNPTETADHNTQPPPQMDWSPDT